MSFRHCLVVSTRALAVSRESDSQPQPQEISKTAGPTRYSAVLAAEGELIDDRELKDSTQDRFRHGDVADLLCEIASTSQTPANVALYGPWGSGKSGIANLVKNRLADPLFVKAHRRTAFFRFDAFQYSGELPLRRAFVINLAGELHSKKRARKVRTQLYASETSNVFDPSKFLPALWRYLALLAVLLAFVTFVTALIGAIGTDDLLTSLQKAATTAVIPAIAPAVFIAGLMAFLNNQLTVKRTTLPPATDDQFEGIFTKLVKDILAKSSMDRLVVFVDELDRCPAQRVVDVLDTVRTFLESAGTIFIVAADREVLEQALKERVSQSTPSDLINPYYSSGSEYLDKVFHYQVNLSPLLPQRVTSYAIGLAEAQSGIWSELSVQKQLPEIMSVLIPSHVRSPRRVKTLLNNYAIAFHTAKRREAEGHIDLEGSDRFLELAKMVCIRTEFPRFGRDLALSDRLPEYFRLKADGSARPDHVPTFVWQAVESYFDEVDSVETMLDDQDRVRVSDKSSPGPSGGQIATTTQVAIRQQLDHYLQKTSRVQDPRRDLIFMEQVGHTYGLSSDLATQLEDLAVRNGRHQAKVLFESNSGIHEEMLRFLSGLAAQSFPGVEGDNVVSVLLATCETAKRESVESAASQAIGAVMTHRRRSDLAEDDLPGALALGLSGQGRDADDLVSAVLGHPSVVENSNVGLAIVTHLDQLPDLGDEGLGSAMTSLLFTPAACGQFLEVLFGHPASVVETAMGAMQPSSVAELTRACALEEESDSERLDTFKRALSDAWETDQAAVREGLLEIWMSSDCDEIDSSEVLQILDGAPLQTKRAVATLLRSIEFLGEDAMAPWVRLLDPGVIGPEHREAVSAIVGTVWKRRRELDPGDLDVVLPLLEPLMLACGSTRSFKPGESVGLETLPLVQERSRLWGDALKFEEAGTHTGAGSMIVGEVAVAFDSSNPSPQESAQLRLLLAEWAYQGMPSAKPEERVELVESVHASSWLDQPAHVGLCCDLSAVAASMGVTDEQRDLLQGLHDVQEVAGQSTDDLVGNISLVSKWAAEFATGPGDLRTLVEPYLAQARYNRGELRAAVRSVADRLSDHDRLELAKHEILSSRRTSKLFLRDLSFETLDELKAAELIVDVFEDASNLGEQQEALELWRLLAPNLSRVRRRLIEAVLIAGLRGPAGRGWLDLLVKNEFVRIWEDPPRGTKEAIKEAMAAVATTADRRRRVRKALSRNSISTSGLGGLLERFFGSGSDD
jgi:hypothetical protein